MNRLGRASAITAAVGFGFLVSGCFHIGEETVVGSNGTADMVVTETLSPVVWASTGIEGQGALTPAKLAKEEAKSPLPGQDSVQVYTDPEGWKGIQVRCTFHSLAALDTVEIAKQGQDNGAGLFSAFSIAQTGSQWVLDAKVDVPAIIAMDTVTVDSSKPSKPKGITRADLAQLGIQVSVSFRLPGQIVSDNATSVSGSVMTWNLLGQVYTLHAVTTTAAPALLTTTTTAPPAGVTTTAPPGDVTTTTTGPPGDVTTTTAPLAERTRRAHGHFSGA